jgi:hypothetical protein
MSAASDPSDATEPGEIPRPLSVGELYAGTLRAWAGGIAGWLPLALVLYAPLLVAAWLFLPDGKHTTTSAVAWAFLGGIGSAAIQTVLSAAIVFGAAPAAGAPRATVGQCLSQAFARFWPYLGLTLLVGLITGAVATPVIVVVVVVSMVRHWPAHGVPGASHSPDANPFLFDPSHFDWDLAAGAVLGAAPLVAIVYAFMLPSTRALMVGRFGPIGSMQESWRLTKGSRLRIWAFFFPLMLVAGVGTVALLIPMASERTRTLLSLTFGAVVSTPFMACAAAVAYDELAARKGGRAATIAKVFE